MLYEEFNGLQNAFGKDFFKQKIKDEILKNLNPNFLIRDYQKEALGRFCFYLEEYQQRQKPIHLMFNMATGSGKTLIMAANMLYLYQKGYRYFIFFVRSTNIIDKTKDNFLNPISKKYLFADKIVLDGQEIKIKEVDNFEAVNSDDINVLFATTALLHSRLNFNRENVLTYEELEGKKIVLIADEAHNLMAETLGRHTQKEEEEKRTWQGTAHKILILSSENILLEFTATARLDYLEVLQEYNNKVIYRYDLKEYRLDGFSKDVRTVQINTRLIERVLAAVVISQYRRKIAEKHKIALKPVIMFKANRVTPPRVRTDLRGTNPRIIVSNEFKTIFHKTIAGLNTNTLKALETINDSTLRKAFQFFHDNKISYENLVQEIKIDFAPEKCLSVDEEKDLEKKQLLLNSLEDPSNEIRAVFATEKLNEGWDVLNLFDIVRLYNSRDARSNQPGPTTVQEAQLIGRGARYYPFTIGEFTDPFRRKFDNDITNELRIIEQLYYHSVTNPRYIQELENVLKREGIMPSHAVKRELKIKDEFKQKEIWTKGIIFINSRKKYLGEDVFGLRDIGIAFDYNAEWNKYLLSTREGLEKDVFSEEQTEITNIEIMGKEIALNDLGKHLVRCAINKFPEFRFSRLKRVFGNLKSISEFIEDNNYLGNTKIIIRGPKTQLEKITAKEKIRIVMFVLGKILQGLEKHKKEYIGERLFRAQRINKIFNDKILQLDVDSHRAENMYDFDFGVKEWFAQNEIWGTSEEESFLRFMDEIILKLKNEYDDIVLLRNEQFFKIYSFDEGLAFSPDFVLFLKAKKTGKDIIYQIFIEPKGDQFLDSNNSFEQSQEGWKQKFLTDIEKNYSIDLKIENKDFRLLGLPFYNESLRQIFEEAFKKRIMK